MDDIIPIVGDVQNESQPKSSIAPKYGDIVFVHVNWIGKVVIQRAKGRETAKNWLVPNQWSTGHSRVPKWRNNYFTTWREAKEYVLHTLISKLGLLAEAQDQGEEQAHANVQRVRDAIERLLPCRTFEEWTRDD